MVDFTRNDLINFNTATHYHVCEISFAPDDTRVCDHCHLTDRKVPRIQIAIWITEIYIAFS